MYAGIWLSDANDQYDSIDIDAEGDWLLYSNGDMIEEGYFRYEPEEDVTYVYTCLDSDVDDGYVDLDGDQLYISTLGSFHYLGRSASEFQGIWYLDNDLSAENCIIIDGYGFREYCQRTPGDAEAMEIDTGIFACAIDEAGIYYANSMMLGSKGYFEIDGCAWCIKFGQISACFNWYERLRYTRLLCILTFQNQKTTFCPQHHSMYDDTSYLVLDFDEGTLVWGDEGVYYWMEDRQ